MVSLLRTAFPFSVLALISVAGCSGKSGLDAAEAAKLRTALTLADEPDGVQTVSEVRMAMLGEAPPNVLALLEEDPDHAGKAETAAAHTNSNAGDAAAVDPHAGEHAKHAEHADHEGEVHDRGQAADLPEEMDVVLVGVVGGVPNPSAQTFAEFPFAKGQAMFFLADPEAVAELEEHSHHHAPGEECAFCAHHAADATALIAAVSFVDKNGKVLQADARDLFDLKENETVVVKGKARVAPGAIRILSVTATGLYVRR